MRKSAVMAAVVSALAAGALTVPMIFGASHREATRILEDPIDIGAFTAPGLTVVAYSSPLADPAGGPTFYPLDETARW